ncbi:MAG: hypothetical protein DME54_05175 [Verrucomicrobia bacterium]|nr:MAG: hypothetical protein DME54_05175 [Verrucomicrobiota bacterium]PYL18146.1 MAG: hypothetical protein DMF41_12850 [Verrucomicrobiota bacterium]PYL80078.1 MAG: hypothetical protein DMF21_10525 [Verrucomicrobiota bacterium]
MSRHDPRVSLLQMQDYARRAQGVIGAHTLEDLSKDDVVRLAIERALEVIGEAANRFPAEFRAKYPDVEWRKIIGMRNVLIHGYDIVQSDVLWDTVQESLPTLLNQIEQMLRDLEKP